MVLSYYLKDFFTSSLTLSASEDTILGSIVTTRVTRVTRVEFLVCLDCNSCAHHKGHNYHEGERFYHPKNELPFEETKRYMKLWWRCIVHPDRHQWYSVFTRSPNAKVRSVGGCPYCLGKVDKERMTLQKQFPLVATYWHPKKNGGIKPTDVSPYSEQRYWWFVKRLDLEYKASVKSQTRQWRNRSRLQQAYWQRYKLKQNIPYGMRKFQVLEIPND